MTFGALGEQIARSGCGGLKAMPGAPALMDVYANEADQPLSAKSFSQSESPFSAALAFRLYSAFSAAVQRKCTCLVLRSLAGRGGLPRFLGVMAVIMGYTKKTCNPSLDMI